MPLGGARPGVRPGKPTCSRTGTGECRCSAGQPTTAVGTWWCSVLHTLWRSWPVWCPDIPYGARARALPCCACWGCAQPGSGLHHPPPPHRRPLAWRAAREQRPQLTFGAVPALKLPGCDVVLPLAGPAQKAHARYRCHPGRCACVRGRGGRCPQLQPCTELGAAQWWDVCISNMGDCMSGRGDFKQAQSVACSVCLALIPHAEQEICHRGWLMATPGLCQPCIDLAMEMAKHPCASDGCAPRVQLPHRV